MKYLFFLKRALKNNTIYRFDYFLGCLNVCIQIFISCEIWKALYITNHVSGKVSLNVVLTSFIINLGLSNIYSIDDLTVQRKFCDGTIICELLKPINYRIYLLADTVGNILFKLLFNLIPCSAIMIIVYRNYFIFCINSCSLCVFFLSIILGFMVLWEISSIVQMLCFWIVNVWSISTIKDVFINVLAGTILPVWYLPEAIQNIIKYTPFAAIYITPLKIYLNQMGTKQQIEALLMQLIWIIILASLSFFIVKTDNLRNVLYWNIKSFMGYPISIYPKLIQYFVVYIIPLAFVNYFPSQLLMGVFKEGNIFPAVYISISAALGMVLFGLSYLFWRFSLRFYASTGS